MPSGPLTSSQAILGVINHCIATFMTQLLSKFK
jgi:hypothetical protein